MYIYTYIERQKIYDRGPALHIVTIGHNMYMVTIQCIETLTFAKETLTFAKNQCALQ